MTTTTNGETIYLSPSIAKTLLTKTPLHAWQAHRLLGGGIPKETDALTDGKVLESLIFGNAMDTLAVLPFDDYRGKEAKAAKEAALLKGLIPIKQAAFEEMSDAAMAMLKGITAAGVAFTGGKTQAKAIWTSNGVDCKGILDYAIMQAGGYIIYDLKCLEDASPDKLAISIGSYGWDIQAAAYIEAMETLHPELAGRGIYKLVCCEKSAPFAVNVVSLSGGFLDLGRRKWARAKALWSKCLASGVWPGYTNTPIEPLPWQLSKEPVEQEVEA